MNMLCQYNYIYANLHKYLKKKNTNQLLEKKKIVTVEINVKML